MNIVQLVNTGITAALLAGEKICKIYASGNFEAEEKADLSPLTKADKEAHLQIKKTLETSQLPIISEEGVQPLYAERKHWQTFWMVDPLDGTKEFINRNDEFTVNIALIHENNPIAGIIYIPVCKELYIGVKGSGTWKIRNPEQDCTFEQVNKFGERLPLPHHADGYTVAASRTHMDDETAAFIENLKIIHPDLKIIRKGSSIKFCMIAEGTADIYPRFGPTMEWDTAAGHALVNSSGKNIFEFEKQTELRYNKENLTNPHFIVL